MDLSDPDMRSARLVSAALSEAGIPSSVCGPLAAQAYGAELCALDIEMVVPEDKLALATETLLSHGLLASLPTGPSSSLPTDWPPSSSYRDRRRLRHGFPIFQPSQQTDRFPPFYVVVYPSTFFGFPPTFPLQQPRPTAATTIADAEDEKEGPSVPTFAQLVEAEMHVLLHRAPVGTSIWSAHLAQLSALSRSPHCKGGPDGLVALVSQRYNRCAEWATKGVEMGADEDEFRKICEP